MIQRTTFALIVGLTTLTAAQLAGAQEFRVYTKIYDMSAKTPVVAARTLALFHAGKVYDHIDKVGEVVIFEPMRKRFTILNTKHALATEIHFDEINKMLKSAREVSERRLKQLDSQNAPTAGLLRFQLNPRFDTRYDTESKRLSLNSPHLQYVVTLKEVETKEIAEAYRQYADWTNRLNFVLHPRRLLPGPRLVVNEQLRARQAVPVDVELHVGQQNPIHVRAAHIIHWKLSNYDRTRITDWKALLADSGTQKMTFREYQKAIR